MRTLVTLACDECKRRNYTTKKNKQHNPERIEFKKYCPWCKKHTVHKETRQCDTLGQQLQWQSGGLQNRLLGVRIPPGLPAYFPALSLLRSVGLCVQSNCK